MYQGLTLAGRYRLDSLIGQGGMGQVWRGTDIRLLRKIAVKLLPIPPGTNPRNVERFTREAHITAGLQHPAITVVFDVDRHEDHLLFLVMELLDGTDLATVMERHPGGLELPRVLTIGSQVAEALEAAHAFGVIHRDIKPGNVILLRGDRVKLCDFGIARYAGGATSLTAGAPVGTPAFMAPEQFEDSRVVDGRADLYALGGLLHVLLTGRQPFEARNLIALMRAVVSDPPPSPRELRPELPEQLDSLVLALLAKNPDHRPSEAGAVAGLLRDLARRLPEAAAHAGGHQIPGGNAHQIPGGNAHQGPDGRDGRTIKQAGPTPAPGRTRVLTVDAGRLPDPAHRAGPANLADPARLAEASAAHQAGWELYLQDKYDEALPRFEEAARIRTAALGADDAATLASRNLVAWTLYWLDRESEALPIAQEITAVRARTLGPGNPDTLDSLDLTARALYALERYAEALPILVEVAEARARVLGPDHPETLSDRSLTARTLHRLARESEALPIAQEVATARAQILGADHPDTLASRNLIARTLYGLKRYAEALPILQEVAQARIQILGPDHPDTLLTLKYIAQTQRKLHS